ncbi:energy transducer TonB [Corallococcus sp. H22C18031201]|nr:energy transducer TonB [Corallococcus sp. H22C18031201]
MSRLALVAALALALPTLALAAGGRPQLQTYFQSSLSNATYSQKTFARVARTWVQPSAKQVPTVGKKAIVQAVLGPDGKLVSSQVLMESGSKAWDAAALAAVKKAAPFDPLPAGTLAPLEVHFHFAWVADK